MGRKRRMGLLAMDLIVTACVSIFCDILALYLQISFDLNDPVFIVYVVFVFVVCIVLSLVIRVRLGASTGSGIQVRQRSTRVGRRGSMTGVDTDQLPPSAAVDQRADQVAGSVTGMRIRQADSPERACPETSAAATADQEEPEQQ
jgi:hypothetical protein